MTFNSLSFLFLFIPVAVALFYIVPRSLKFPILVLASLVFYAWGNPWNLVILILSMAFNYLAGLEINALRRAREKKRGRIAVITTVAANLLLLGFYKYAGFFLGIFGIEFQAQSMPIGISFFTFSIISFILDIWNGRAKFDGNPVNYVLYVSFFPKITSGPIVQYHEMKRQMKQPKPSAVKLEGGLRLFMIGLFKKVLIADNLATAFASIQALGSGMGMISAWLGLFYYSLQLYFDFSGYSDMAIGLARMFGFTFNKNFDYPYTADNATDFWRRWHISLGAWFREYVYIPLGGNRCSAPRQFFNLVVVWLLTGLWHGASWNYVLWGLYHGAFVMLDKFVIGDIWNALPKILRQLGTALMAFIGWIFFFTPDLSSFVRWLTSMFGAGGLIDHYAFFSFRQNLILLIIAFIGSTPWFGRKLRDLSCKREKQGMYLSLAFYIVMFVLCIAGMIANTYSSFLYYQF